MYSLTVSAFSTDKLCLTELNIQQYELLITML